MIDFDNPDWTFVYFIIVMSDGWREFVTLNRNEAKGFFTPALDPAWTIERIRYM